MNTDYITALGAGPPFLLVPNKMSYAGLLYVLEIFDHAHAILGSIALIQMVEPCTRKAVTTEAVLKVTFRYLLTVFDFTLYAGLRFETVITSATGTCLLISYICLAEATVHSAGSDQGSANRLCRSDLRHVCIPAKTYMAASIVKPNILFYEWS
jgi:hypothetical protein